MEAAGNQSDQGQQGQTQAFYPVRHNSFHWQRGASAGGRDQRRAACVITMSHARRDEKQHLAAKPTLSSTVTISTVALI